MGAAFMGWFSRVSTQFIGQHLEKERLSRVPEEVVTGKHPQGEGGVRLLTPGFEIATTHPLILQAAKSGDGTVERRLGCVHVRFVNGEIGSQDRKHDLHEFCFFQHFSGNAIQAVQFDQQFPLGQGMERPVSMRNLRRAIRCDEQVNRLSTRLSPELTGKFKAHQCSQTMTEEGKRLVQEWLQGLGEGLDERRELRERSLHQAGSPTGELNRADLNIRRQAVRPSAKNRGPASCVREAEQAEASLWVRFAAGNPGIKGGCVGHGSIFLAGPFSSGSNVTLQFRFTRSGQNANWKRWPGCLSFLEILHDL